MKFVEIFREVILFSIFSMGLAIAVMSYNESYIDYSNFSVDPHLPFILAFFVLFMFIAFYTKNLCKNNSIEKKILIILLSANGFLAFELFVLALFSTLDVTSKFILFAFFLMCLICTVFLQYAVQKVIKEE